MKQLITDFDFFFNDRILPLSVNNFTHLEVSQMPSPALSLSRKSSE